MAVHVTVRRAGSLEAMTQQPATPEPAPGAARVRRRWAVMAVAIGVLVALTGWLGVRDQQVRSREETGRQMVEAAKAALVSLTTIDHERVDEDVQRILDTSTGAFRDDFEKRARPFAEAARTAPSKSVGTVTEAAVESVSGDEGRVLVAMTVMASNRGAPERLPRSWRTRVTVSKTDSGMKVSQVEFVP